MLSFGYFEFDEFPPSTGRRGLSGSKFFTDADGVIVSEVDRFTYTVRFRGKTVTFHFHQLDQTPPDSLVLAEDETFIQRTLDESGYHFALLFNEQTNFFLWVLNEDEPIPETLDPVGDDLLIGRRSGFAFWVDAANEDRLILAGVRQLNIRRNDYYDGPFDQLADNYADETRVSEYMVRAFPALEGRIDKYGYYTDRDRPLRVAISSYYTYGSQTQMLQFIEIAQAQPDPYFYVSRGGRVEVIAEQEEDADAS